jgi:tetratricopeptide (TPR) repeat protein
MKIQPCTDTRFTLAGPVLMIALIVSSCARTPAQREARYLQRGQENAQKQDYRRAILELRNAVQVMPKDAEPVYRLAMVYVEMHDYRTAFALLKKAVDLNPKHAAAQMEIAKFQATSRKQEIRDEGKQRIENVLASNSGDADALNTLAALDLRSGNLDKAVQDLQIAVDKSPQDVLSAVNLARMKLKQNDRAGAEAVLKNAAVKAPRSSQAALALANFYITVNKIPEAESEVRRAVQLDGANATALTMLANFQNEHGQREEAEKTYARISALPDQSLKIAHASYLFREGKRDEAIAELNQLLKEHPDYRNVRNNLVGAYMHVGKPQEAERILNEALKRNPKDVDALLQRSAFFLNAGKPDQAEADLHSALSSNPESADAHYSLARVAALRGSSLVQRQELSKAMQLNPQMLAARIELSKLLRPKDPKAALETLNEAPAVQKQVLDFQVERNWVLLALSQYTELEQNLKTALVATRSPDFLYQAALLKLNQKDSAGARPLLEEVLKQLPDNMTALDLLGKTYSAQGNPAKGFDVVKQYASQRPKSPFLWSLVGIWEAQAGQFAEARQTFSRVVDQNPDFITGSLALSDVEVSLGHLDEAHRILQGVLTKQPANLQARHQMAMLEEKKGNHAAAQADLRAILQAQPTNESALNALASNLASENPDEALKYAQQAVELAPDDPAAQDTLGWIYYRKNLYESALTYFKGAVTKQPTATRKYHLALAYAKMGDRELAKENLDAALRLDPKLQMPEPLPR